MNILVTGGCGYIGSHTAVELLNSGYNVIIVDNLYNSKKDVILKIEKITGKSVKFYEKDVTKEDEMNKIFSENKIDAVIHFAGYKAVGESSEKPLKYYFNNLLSTMVIAKMCCKYEVNKIIFSSSATVYGDNKVPLIESMNLMPTTNPYGETKVMCERILTDFANRSNVSVTLLRYFNPVGAHESGLIGELPNGIPNNLMPYITQVASGKREKLYVFGNDYNTVDGTGVRDFVHVVDLAKGHVQALKHANDKINIYNLGTGKGTSVIELITAFENINNIKIPYEITNRRDGDIAECYANCDKAFKDLEFSCKYSIEDMCRDSWNFENNQNK